jgi:transposase
MRSRRPRMIGNVTEHHRYMLKILLKQVQFLEAQIEDLDHHIQEKMRTFEEELQLLDTIDGVDQRTVQKHVGRDWSGYESKS